MTTEPQEFWSSDLYFSAYLKASGLLLLKTVPGARGKLHWVFDSDSGNLSELTQAWMDHSGMVSARDYQTEIRQMKSQCFGGDSTFEHTRLDER